MSRRRNYTEYELRQIRELEEKVEFAPTVSTINRYEFRTTEELYKQQVRSIAKGRKLNDYRLPATETFTKRNGEEVEVALIYNTKRNEADKAFTKRYKTEMCQYAPNCKFEDSCSYAHSEEDLLAYKCLDKYFEETKIGTPEHHEPCQNQQCPIRLRLLLRKTVICKYWEDDDDECHREKSTCCYAHGDCDRKPLPKFELCKKHKMGQCNLDHTECVYAHGDEELRRKLGAKKVKQATCYVDEDFHEYELSSSPDYDEGLRNAVHSFVLSANLSFEVGIDEVRLCEPCQNLKDNLPERLQKHYFAY